MLLAVAVTLATPKILDTAVGLERVAPGPLVGAANETVTPLTGLPIASFTVACKAVGNPVFIEVDCGVPPVAVMKAKVVLVN